MEHIFSLAFSSVVCLTFVGLMIDLFKSEKLSKKEILAYFKEKAEQNLGYVDSEKIKDASNFDNDIHFYLYTDLKNNVLLKFTYDFKNDIFLEQFVSHRLNNIDPGEVFHLTQKMKSLIPADAVKRRENSMRQIARSNAAHKALLEVDASFENDLVLKEIKNIKNLSSVLLVKGYQERFLSLDEISFLEKTIPFELLELEKIYLSLSDESKISMKDRVLGSVSLLKSEIEKISKKEENKKEDELEQVAIRIRKKITRRN